GPPRQRGCRAVPAGLAPLAGDRRRRDSGGPRHAGEGAVRTGPIVGGGGRTSLGGPILPAPCSRGRGRPARLAAAARLLDGRPLLASRRLVGDVRAGSTARVRDRSAIRWKPALVV